MSKDKSVLITVGTTCFDTLIKETDKESFVNLLKSQGFNRIIYQIGNGSYIPVNGQHFTLTPEINKFYSESDLLITHGGAGTLLQNLHNQKMIIAVPNEELMGNHQVELIEKLNEEGLVLGFRTFKEFENGEEKILNFLKTGCRNKMERPRNCILNEIVFGKEKVKEK